MNLRKLRKEDAKWMLEWMHDTSVVQDLLIDFSVKSLNDCFLFIEKSVIDKENLNLAIVDENDTYMGTVSLKHINREQKSAEFAITLRKIAMGKGYAIFGMNQIFELAKKELKLNLIYWCVSKKNLRAIRFYNKNGFELCFEIPFIYTQCYQKDILEDLIWYSVQL